MTRIYSPEEVAELERLYSELPVAIARAAAALRAHEALHEERLLKQPIGEDAKMTAIRDRIKAILTGGPTVLGT